MSRTALAFAAASLVACAAQPTDTFGPVFDGGVSRDRPAAQRDQVTPQPSTDLGVAPLDAPVMTPADVASAYDTGASPMSSDACAPSGATCSPRPDGCEARERCGNGLDDNCDGVVDESCPCVPGTVQDCFLGPPGRRGAGQCSGGTQRCLGTGEFGTWGACDGALAPSAEVCDSLDNDCDGCVDEGLCCNAELSCPGAGDARVPEGAPFQAYPLRGRQFYPGEARAWRWTVRGGPCDAVLPRPTFQLLQADQRDAAIIPTLSGDYTVTLTVTTLGGQTLTCTFVVHIAGPGLRVELCWDTSTTVDLDLYVHDPRNMGPWFDGPGSPLQGANNNSCNWSNCEATIRGTRGRVNWGYGPSPLAACENGPLGAGWRAMGACANPRLDIDNNLVKASGVPENMNVDAPRNGERFRIMVQNYSGRAARPLVNVYCGGRLRGSVGPMPGEPWDLTGASGSTSVGAMWRVADVAVRVDGAGLTTGCDVTPLRAPGMTGGYFVTRNDPSY